MALDEMIRVEDEDKPTTENNEEPTPGCYVKGRYVLALMIFFGEATMYSMRVNLSVAIVAMVNLTQSSEKNVSDSCPDRGVSEIGSTASNGKENWDSTQQGLLLGCFYYGYIFSGLPGGYLANRYGVKLVMGIPMFLSSIITIFTPQLAHASFPLMVTGRILLGFLQGVILPSVQSAWGKWAPPMERTRLITMSFSGMGFGIFATLLMAGVVAENLGWEAVFYITGGASLVWSCVWFGIIHSWPQSHPRISIQERTYIVNSIGAPQTLHSKHPPTPWRRIFTSRPIWAIIIVHFCHNYGVYTLMSMLPTYMATMLRFNIAKSGGLTAIPYILQLFSAVAMGYISDELRRRGLMSTLNVRKLNTTLCTAVPASLMILAGYVGCNAEAAVAFFALSVAFSALSAAGYEANTVDLSPMFGGIIYGISNTLANIPGFLSPQVVGVMLSNDESFHQWRNIFYLTAGIYAVGLLFYLFFASAQEQPWGSEKQTPQAGETKGVTKTSLQQMEPLTMS